MISCFWLASIRPSVFGPSSVLRFFHQPDTNPHLVFFSVFFFERAWPIQAERCRLYREVLLGLRHCHSHSILHRDVKPTNILIYIDSGLLELSKNKKQLGTPFCQFSKFFGSPFPFSIKFQIVQRFWGDPSAASGLWQQRRCGACWLQSMLLPPKPRRDDVLICRAWSASDNWIWRKVHCFLALF